MCCEASLRLCVDILQQTEASKSPKSLTFQVFRHYETSKILIFRFSNFFSEFSNFFECLQRAIFDILQQNGFSKSRNGPPFYNFINFALFEP